MTKNILISFLVGSLASSAFAAAPFCKIGETTINKLRQSLACNGALSLSACGGFAGSGILITKGLMEKRKLARQMERVERILPSLEKSEEESLAAIGRNNALLRIAEHGKMTNY
jgi:hypothetical protein